MRSPLSTMRGGIRIQVEIPQDLTRGQKNPVLGAWVKKLKTPKIKYVKKYYIVIRHKKDKYFILK